MEKDLQELRLEREEADADKLWKSVYEKEDEPPTDEPPKEEPHVEKVDEPAAEPEPVPVQVETPPVETPPEPVKATDWEQKYKTLEGKYRAEIPRLTQELRQNKDIISHLNTKVSALEEKLKAPPTKIENLPEEDIDKLEADYPDVGKMIKKITARYEARISELENNLASKTQETAVNVNTTLTETRKSQFDSHMQVLGVPDWKELDYDAGFNEWLQEPISPYTDITRADALRHAASKYDAPKVAEFFKDYKATLIDTKSVPPDKEKDAQDKLKPFIAPPKSDVGTSTKGAVNTAYTRESYTQFMKDTSKGKFNPQKWGGKTEEQVEAIFDELIVKGKLQ